MPDEPKERDKNKEKQICLFAPISQKQKRLFPLISQKQIHLFPLISQKKKTSFSPYLPKTKTPLSLYLPKTNTPLCPYIRKTNTSPYPYVKKNVTSRKKKHVRQYMTVRTCRLSYAECDERKKWMCRSGNGGERTAAYLFSASPPSTFAIAVITATVTFSTMRHTAFPIAITSTPPFRVY